MYPRYCTAATEQTTHWQHCTKAVRGGGAGRCKCTTWRGKAPCACVRTAAAKALCTASPPSRRAPPPFSSSTTKAKPCRSIDWSMIPMKLCITNNTFRSKPCPRRHRIRPHPKRRGKETTVPLLRATVRKVRLPAIGTNTAACDTAACNTAACNAAACNTAACNTAACNTAACNTAGTNTTCNTNATDTDNNTTTCNTATCTL